MINILKSTNQKMKFGRKPFSQQSGGVRELLKNEARCERDHITLQ